MRIGMLHSRIRAEEKTLIEAARAAGHEIKPIDVRHHVFGLGESPPVVCDVILERCVSHSQALAAIHIYESAGIPCVNRFQTALICGDKLLTSQALINAGVPTPRTAIAFDIPSGLNAIEDTSLRWPAISPNCIPESALQKRTLRSNAAVARKSPS